VHFFALVLTVVSEYVKQRSQTFLFLINCMFPCVNLMREVNTSQTDNFSDGSLVLLRFFPRSIELFILLYPSFFVHFYQIFHWYCNYHANAVLTSYVVTTVSFRPVETRVSEINVHNLIAITTTFKISFL